MFLKAFNFTEQSLKRDFFSASFFTFLSSILIQGSAFASTLLLAKLMGNEDFGKYTIIYSSTLFLSIVTIFGGTIPLSKAIAEYISKSETESVSRIIKINLQISYLTAFF